VFAERTPIEVCKHRCVARIATIGVYGFDGERFVETLDGAGVTLVVDVRQRRGVRGSQ
jgi:hypothetical protein